MRQAVSALSCLSSLALAGAKSQDFALFCWAEETPSIFLPAEPAFPASLTEAAVSLSQAVTTQAFLTAIDFTLFSPCSVDGFQLHFPLPHNNKAGEKMSHVVCAVLPVEWKKMERKLRKGPTIKTVSWKTVSSFCICDLSLWKAECALGAADLLSYVLPRSKWAVFMALLCFHFLFLFEFQEQEHVHSYCQRLCLAQPSLKYPYAISSLDRFFSISLNVHINVPYSFPTLKSYRDTTAVSCLTTQTRALPYPQLL